MNDPRPKHAGLRRRVALALGAIACLGLISFVLWGNRQPEVGELEAVDQGSPASPPPMEVPPRQLEHHLGRDSAARVSGSVVGVDGEPVSEARVCVFGSLARAPTKPEGCVQSGVNGEFVLDVPVGRPLVISASTPGMLPGWFGDPLPTVFEVQRGHALDGIQLVLSSVGARRITGTVRDSYGGPIESVAVYTQEGFSTISDEEGQFEVWAREHAATITATHPEYQTTRRTTIAPATGFRLVLPPRLAIAGTVYSPEGNPVEGARVYTSSTAAGKDDRAEMVYSDTAGRYTLDDVGPWEYKPVAVAPSGRGEATSVRPSAGVVAQADIHLAAHGSIIATISLEEDDCRAPRLVARGDGASLSTASSHNGRLQIDGVQVGKYLVTASCENAQPSSQSKVVERGETVELEFELSAARRATGTVTDPAGTPLAGAEVSFWTRTARASTRTSSDGTFNLYVPSGEVLANATLDSISSSVARMSDPSEPIDFVIAVDGDGMGTVGGVVRTAEGSPVPNLDVRLAPETLPGHHDTERTDAAGRFAFRGVPPSNYSVVASWWGDPRQAPNPPSPTRVEVKDGSELELEFSIEAPTGLVSGSVVDEEGSPVVDASVWLSVRGGAGGTFTDMTDNDGRFSIDGVTGLAYRLLVTPAEGPRTSVELEPRQKDVVVRIGADVVVATDRDRERQPKPALRPPPTLPE